MEWSINEPYYHFQLTKNLEDILIFFQSLQEEKEGRT